MTETKTVGHTPGPWYVHEHRDIQDQYFDIRIKSPTGGHGPQIANVNQHIGRSAYTGTANASANARLIAAAPELLDALKGLLPMWDSGIQEPWIDAARVAIAKATGAGRAGVDRAEDRDAATCRPDR